MSFYTFQDFTAAGDKAAFVAAAVWEHKTTPAYRMAVDADEYDHQRNVTICNFVRTLMSGTGNKIIDITAANNKITSNFFRRLNTQRNMYSLGNGLTFTDEIIKKRLGAKFDTQIKKAGYKALIHGVVFVFWNIDKLHVFPLTEFAPLWNEDTGSLGAGVRFWQLAPDKPTYAVLYEADGYTKYQIKGDDVKTVEGKRAYKHKVEHIPAIGDEVIGEDNYGVLPIVPLWGSELKQSTLEEMRQSIDSYDLIRSGFANDLTDCAQIYWILKNCGGLEDADLARFREQLLFRHIANIDADSGVDITPYTQEIPYQARQVYLDGIRSGIYEDFGALDVRGISATTKTATEINAAYQPLDENADDYEYQIIECVQQILALQGVTGEKAVPQFKRNRISNQLEQVEMVVMEAPYLDDETILNKLPNVTPDEVEAILKKKDVEAMDRLSGQKSPDEISAEDSGGEDE